MFCAYYQECAMSSNNLSDELRLSSNFPLSSEVLEDTTVRDRTLACVILSQKQTTSTFILYINIDIARALTQV